MDKPIKISLAITGVIAIAAGIYFYKQNEVLAEKAAQAAATPVPVEAQATPSERYPVPEAKADSKTELPDSLESSDPSFQNALMALIGEDVFSKIFVSENLIRRMVVMVDNATEKNLPIELMPYLPLTGAFPVIKKDDEFFTDPAKSEKRYQIYTDFILKADAKSLVDLYFHYYPLVQKAFKEVKPQGHFNDRLIEVIDHLEATPQVKGPKELLAYNQSYKYEELEIEDLSVSQKMLIRMGENSSQKVKEKLRKIRELVILGH